MDIVMFTALASDQSGCQAGPGGILMRVNKYPESRCWDVVGGGELGTNTIHHPVLSSEQIKSRQEENCK